LLQECNEMGRLFSEQTGGGSQSFIAVIGMPSVHSDRFVILKKCVETVRSSDAVS
jgi:hypothetical protein